MHWSRPDGIGARIAGALLALALAAPPATGCTVSRRGTAPLDVVAGRLILTVVVNGHDALFTLDTGAARSVVTPAAVRRLGLRLDSWVNATIIGAGGEERHRVADPTSLALAGIRLRQQNLLGKNALAVASLPEDMIGGRAVDGLLGRDLLSAFDLDVDVPARRLALYTVAGCSGHFLPWRLHYAAIPALPAYRHALVIALQADGQSLRAMPDTGSAASLIVAPGMARLGLTFQRPAPEHAVSVNGIGAFARVGRIYRFGVLQVGGVSETNVDLLAVPFRVYPTVDMLLGADWFSHRRVWLSYSTRQVFVERSR
jgi:predicted aspartyl protease